MPAITVQSLTQKVRRMEGVDVVLRGQSGRAMNRTKSLNASYSYQRRISGNASVAKLRQRINSIVPDACVDVLYGNKLGGACVISHQIANGRAKIKNVRASYSTT